MIKQPSLLLMVTSNGDWNNLLRYKSEGKTFCPFSYSSAVLFSVLKLMIGECILQGVTQRHHNSTVE